MPKNLHYCDWHAAQISPAHFPSPHNNALEDRLERMRKRSKFYIPDLLYLTEYSYVTLHTVPIGLIGTKHF